MNLRWVWGRVVIFDLDFFRIIQRRDDDELEDDSYSVSAQLQIADTDQADDEVGGSYYGFGFGRRS